LALCLALLAFGLLPLAFGSSPLAFGLLALGLLTFGLLALGVFALRLADNTACWLAACLAGLLVDEGTAAAPPAGALYEREAWLGYEREAWLG